ncbi:hypothetical protein [Sphingomonas panni]|uniref:hypothetical protein n=1 Tax=Sphingomonas panni TaxID=237612 RepID=UPI001F5B141C|nr:hypothetical protein [Sphingomonas panni]
MVQRIPGGVLFSIVQAGDAHQLWSAPTMSLENLVAAISEARDRLSGLEREIAVRRQMIVQIEHRPPHTDDIIASFRRGLAQAEALFLKQLSWSLNDRAATANGAQQAVRDYSPHLLTPHSTNPGYDSLLPPSVMDWTAPPPGIAALLYFLRDKIDEEIPVLVDRMCPIARKGMKHADRVAEIGTLQAEIAVLDTEASELRDKLSLASAEANRQ